MIHHDRLFKELLREFFIDFLELFLPELIQYLDRTALEFLDKEVFTDVTSGEAHEADVVVKTRFRDRQSYFLVHGEHQAQAQAGFGRRMFQYFARLHEKHALPVLLFDWQADTLLERNEKEAIMELTTSWKEEGRYEADQQLVLRLLRRRWRNLDPALAARVRELAVEPLETLAEDLLDFTGPADLEHWLNQRR